MQLKNYFAGCVVLFVVMLLSCAGLGALLSDRPFAGTARTVSQSPSPADAARPPKQRQSQPPEEVAAFLSRYGDPDHEEDNRWEAYPSERGGNILTRGWLLTYRTEKVTVFISGERAWYFDATTRKEIDAEEACRRLAGRDHGQ